MLEKLKNSSQFKQVKQQAKIVGSRLADHHVSLAITGLSKSGKTAFITSLVNQLLEARDSASLPFFSVTTEARLIGVKRELQPDVTIARFTYEEGIESLNSHPPEWPASTNGVSQVRLLIRYKNKSGIRKLLSEQTTLTLDITDYPGEWLLDLPLLELSFEQWCQHFWEDLENPEKRELAKEFIAALSSYDFSSSVDEMAIQQIATVFTDYLHSAKDAGYQLIQPGRFVLPGEYEGAPVLHFFPLPLEKLNHNVNNSSESDAETSCRLMINRYDQYKEQVVKPFYKRHFRRFDRQIILVDCLSALNMGPHSFNDLKKAIHWLLSSFHYGRSSILKRVFSPRIDRLLFAASKADHITPDQQENLVKLLESVVHEARQQIQFEGVETESTAISAIRASVAGATEHNGEQIQVLKGQEMSGEQVTLFPGEVPSECPPDNFWQQQGFSFPKFAPPSREKGAPLPHIRMDQILEFVLGDKLQ